MKDEEDVPTFAGSLKKLFTSEKSESHHSNAFVDLNEDGNADIVVTHAEMNRLNILQTKELKIYQMVKFTWTTNDPGGGTG